MTKPQLLITHKFVTYETLEFRNIYCRAGNISQAGMAKYFPSCISQKICTRRLLRIEEIEINVN